MIKFEYEQFQNVYCHNHLEYHPETIHTGWCLTFLQTFINTLISLVKM